jgi:hypothetical protein
LSPSPYGVEFFPEKCPPPKTRATSGSFHVEFPFAKCAYT